MKNSEIAKFKARLAELQESQEWSIIAQRQQALSDALDALKKGQEEVRAICLMPGCICRITASFI